MHTKKTKRSLIAATLSVILAVLFGGFFAQSVRAVVNNPTPICFGSLCTLTFEPAGDYYLWSPPQGAKNITFDLLGAQGGRSGGQGGRVVGSLTSVPSALYIYVGGAGLQSAGAAGGFNGGGSAGTGRGDEGSGGGATDIRLTNSVNDRIAVAGGGGGSGGFSGGSGGAAGGANASSGTSGQGQGGSGATLSSGGNGGYPNGGSWGSAGELALGGAGGSSYVSGGGGGGGGYYGGGGGGADIDTCCSNAGGGGGGSSWNHSSQTSAVTHTAGYRAGAGLAVIKYSIPPKVDTFAAVTTLTNATSISYNLNFNEAVTGLTSSDFTSMGSTAICDSVVVSGSGASYLIQASGCSVGILKLSLNSNSISGALTGPAAATPAADVEFERNAPTLQVSAPPSPSSALALSYGFEFNETVTGLNAEDFRISGAGCELGLVSGSNRSYTIQVSACQNSAEAKLSLEPNSVTDLAGNLGPSVSPVFATVVIDRTAPALSWVRPVSASTSDEPSFGFLFSEEVSGIHTDDFLMIGDATGCEFTVVQITPGSEFRVDSTNCSLGTVQILLQANSFQDSIGNNGPAVVSASSVITKTARVAAAPAPSPIATPIAKSPAAAPPIKEPETMVPESPAPETTVPGTIVSEIRVPEASTIIEAQPVRKTYAFTPAEVTTQQNPEAYEIAPLAETAQITLQNPTSPMPLTKPDSFQNILLLTTGIVSTALAAIGFFKLAQQFRSRRLVKKFS